jgi:hypothetical protein
MGFQASATSVTIRARLTNLGRKKLIENSNTAFSHFMLGDSDANYYTSEPLPTGLVPGNSGNLAFISGSTSDNIASGVGINSKLWLTTVSSGPLKLKQNSSSTLVPTLRLIGETTVSGDNVSYVTISKSATTSEFTNLFKSLSLPLSTANILTFSNTLASNGGWADTPFSGLGVSNVLLSVINNDQYGELIDGKSIKVTLPVYTGYTTGGTPTGATTYTLYSTFPKTSWTNTSLDYWYKDESDTRIDLFGNRINVAYLVSDDIQKPNNDPIKSWSTGYDSYKPFSLGNKETINKIAVSATGINSDRIAGIAYLDKGILAITDQTIVNNIATNFSGDPTTNTINNGLGLYYYSAGTYNTVIDSIQNDLVQDIVCVADKGQFYNTQNPTFNINDNVRISEIAITDGTRTNILAIGKTDRHIIKTKNEMIIFNVEIVI